MAESTHLAEIVLNPKTGFLTCGKVLYCSPFIRPMVSLSGLFNFIFNPSCKWMVLQILFCSCLHNIIFALLVLICNDVYNLYLPCIYGRTTDNSHFDVMSGDF